MTVSALYHEDSDEIEAAVRGEDDEVPDGLDRAEEVENSDG